jgi:hypothetical protein
MTEGIFARPSRRGVLALGAVGAAHSVLGGTLRSGVAVASAATPSGPPQSVLDAADHLRACDVSGVPAGDPRLLQSFADEFGLFTTGLLEDTAVATIALAAVPGGLPDAQALARGLATVATGDRSGERGRTRRGYVTAPFTFYDGSEHAGLVLPGGTTSPASLFGLDTTETGSGAWAGLALLHVFLRTGDDALLAAALDIASWIESRAANPGPIGGFTSVSMRPVPVVRRPRRRTTSTARASSARSTR